MNNYVIAMGGTGTRCLEAMVYLTAAGIFEFDRNTPLQVLILDPDKNNGNSKKTNELIASYQLLQNAIQPEAEQERYPRPAGAFRTKINPGGEPVFWQNPSENQKFRNAIQYDQELDQNARHFLDLFFSGQDLEMELDVGYRGRTGVGAIAMRQHLQASSTNPVYGLKPFVEKLSDDAQKGTSPKLFATGSVFGGTGATGLASIPERIKGFVNPRRQEGAGGVTVGDKIRFGCAMMAPYFVFPSCPRETAEKGPAPEAALHPVATKAVLMHYGHEHPPYQHIYLIGAPNRKQTNKEHVSGGGEQRNSPHYAELVAALAAWDFFGRAKVDPSDRKLHYADSISTTPNQQQGDREDRAKDVGVGWSTLPVRLGAQNDASARNVLKYRLVAFTTFMYFYKNFLFPAIEAKQHLKAIFYRNNFHSLSLGSGQNPDWVKALNNFATLYLSWLEKVGETIDVVPADANDRLFAFDAFKTALQKPEVCADFLRRLAPHPEALSGVEAYNNFMDELNGRKIAQPGQATAAGLLIHLLYEAAWSFCEKNYKWRADGSAA
jgi:hypothetical protein